MKLECYPTMTRPPDIVPGRPQRAWMDAFSGRHPYRCLPMTMANSTGWEVLCPVGFTAEWNGGVQQTDITLAQDKPLEDVELVQKSLDRDLDLRGQYDAWRARREEFNTRLFKRDPGAMREAWQRYYFKGEMPDDRGPAPKVHANKRRMK